MAFKNLITVEIVIDKRIFKPFSVIAVFSWLYYLLFNHGKPVFMRIHKKYSFFLCFYPIAFYVPVTRFRWADGSGVAIARRTFADLRALVHRGALPRQRRRRRPRHTSHQIYNRNFTSTWRLWPRPWYLFTKSNYYYFVIKLSDRYVLA